MNDVLYRDIIGCKILRNGVDIPEVICEAPAYSGILVGDVVVIDIGYMKATARVTSVHTEPLNGASVTFGRVLKTVVYAPFDWNSIDEERKERMAVETEKA